MPENYYNENDPRAAEWLRELIKEGLIPNGYVDERSIQDVRREDLQGYRQCHFFAGIGGWPYAIQLAAWPRDVPVWTGSCPCQPLSCAGQRKGEVDERHLWPDFYRLIAECRPATIFGEQVASSDGLEWLDGISLDLEDLDYAFAAADLPAAGVGAPQERQRLFWVACAEGVVIPRRKKPRKRSGEVRKAGSDEGSSSGRSCGVDNATPVADTDLPSEHGRTPGGEQSLRHVGNGCDEAVGHAAGPGQQEQWREYRPSGEGCSGLVGFAMQVGVPSWNGPTIAVKCSDGPRRVSAEPGAFPLAHGLPARMGRLRGYGNAIVPQVAERFVRAFMESQSS